MLLSGTASCLRGIMHQDCDLHPVVHPELAEQPRHVRLDRGLTHEERRRDFGVGGTLSGRAGNGQFNVVVTSAGFTANLTLQTSGSKQNVNISSEGQFRGAKITLTRT